MLETLILLTVYVTTCYAIPVLLLIIMNKEQPNSREAVAIDPELRSSKRYA